MKLNLLNLSIFLYSFTLAMAAQQTLAANNQPSQTLKAILVNEKPTIDGKHNEAVWLKAQAITTRDKIDNREITLKSVYTQEMIFFYVTFADDKEEREHKTMLWDDSIGLYKGGPKREDIFVFKWNMEKFPVDLTLISDDNYFADIWYWKSMRTDHADKADDKIQHYTSYPIKKSKKMVSPSGKVFYLKRSGDAGNSAYKARFFEDKQKDSMPRFAFRIPQGSRADIQAKGVWENGFWHIEFARKLNTQHNDDVQLLLKNKYQFGVSLYEIAGRKKDPKSEKPSFGSGDINELIELEFQ